MAKKKTGHDKVFVDPYNLFKQSGCIKKRSSLFFLYFLTFEQGAG